ncbi:cysteine-rich protein 2 [Chanos chanos]|uniref:Cysteine-rich protein 1 n=1 Tax=Chanos chanos TaxID=29144 RepID=A0A6J2WJT2_CHACN|nr:cysteine-rich protein 2-like [Chanos chanos]
MVSYCPICGKPVYFGEKKRSLGRDYHPLCLKCHKCKRQLTAGQHAEHDEKPYCSNCYMRHFGPRVQGQPSSVCLATGPRKEQPI